MTSYSVVAFEPAVHRREAFASGSARIDNFLQLTAKKQQNNGSVRVWVALPDNSLDIAGFYAVNAASLDATKLPEPLASRAPGHGKIPAIYLSVLGVTTNHQGTGLGRALMGDAFKRTLVTAQHIGVAVLTLDILDEGDSHEVERRRRFYLRLGFEEFPDHPMSMFIAVARIHAATAFR